MKIGILSPEFIKRALPCASAFLFLFLRPATQSRAASVGYTATDLADTTPGEDLWLYTYTMSNFTFGAGQGFNVTFDRTLFTKLQSPPPPVNADWDVITLQPDLALSSNGLYDALALRISPSLANSFNLSVVWLGSGSPGMQPFTIYDTNFTPIEQGVTIPEPAAIALLFTGLGPLACRRRPQGAAVFNRRPNENRAAI